MKIPTGTTPEQWLDYEVKKKAHELFIHNYKFFLNRIVRHLEFVQPGKQWTLEEMQHTIMNEIKMSDSIDAPNKPGYYRANND